MSNLLQSPELLQERRTTSQLELTRRRCLKPDGFEWFIDNVFSAGFDEFIGGEYITEVAQTMEQHPWTMDVTGRDHFKSTRFYAEIMFDIFTSEKALEAHYFSYNSDLSRYHLKKVKQLIKNNPFFVLVVDLNPTADALLEYWNGYARYTCSPAGLLSFKRGIHADRLYIDDPLKDPENKLAPIVIHKINRTITTEIYPMVNKGGKCRVVGTPQTHEDFFFNEALAKRWHITIKDVMVDETNRIALWPEWHPFEELEDIRNTIGERTFNQEYRAKPAYMEESYIPRARLLRLINPDLINQRGYDGEHDTVAGYDIGKHTHPAHLAIFERWYNNDLNAYFYRQLLSQWFDNWDYEAQLNHLVELIDLFKIATLRYDNTRGEFEGFAEQGKVPRQMKPVTFTLRSKNAMAANLDSIVTGERAELINDQRQTNQILSVTSDLQAFESPEGHGDSFWSVGMALYEEKETVYRARTI